MNIKFTNKLTSRSIHQLAWRRGCVGALACWLVSVLAIAPVFAQGGIKASNASVESSFAEYIRYRITLQSDSDITAATVIARYKTGDPGLASTRGKAEFAPGKNVTVVFTRTLQRGGLVPGTDIEYYWEVENAAGQTLKTDKAIYTFLDDRFDFKTMSAPVGKGAVTVFWYGASDDYGRGRLRVAVEAIRKLQQQVGVELTEDAKIFIYRSREDMLAALPTKGLTADAGLVTLGQLATPNTVLLLGGHADVDNTTYHELSHLVVHLAATNPLIGGVSLPAWLDEGLSMYNQLTVERGFLDSLDRAVRTDRLISVRSMVAIPGQPDQVILFYAEAYSLVKYLIETHGKDKMVQLLNVFKRGALVEDALKEVYGFGVQSLDDRWRASLRLAPRDITGTAAPPSRATAPAVVAQPTPAAQATAPAAALPTPAPQNPAPNTPQSSGGILQCLGCVSGLGLVLLWLLFMRKSA